MRLYLILWNILQTLSEPDASVSSAFYAGRYSADSSRQKKIFPQQIGVSLN